MKKGSPIQPSNGRKAYNHSALDNVIRYIHNQKEHHQNKRFKEEYLELPEQFYVEYKQEYLFEWL
ncbi:hypothetical protein [Niabella aurantiaca]|uniref:hypothetical protein n=1 Tax=Niabella aurantiaca TaxID=379900 RepID=UPI0003A22B22|nr:hypothetical protein [Niabella aurantiaca]